MLTNTPAPKIDNLRNIITNAYRMDENACLKDLIQAAYFNDKALNHIEQVAYALVKSMRENLNKQSKIDTLLRQYDLSTEEGIALMCLAESLLRIPDKSTIDKLISDKLSTIDWKKTLNRDNTFFANAATWSLLLTGKIYAPNLNQQQNFLHSIKRSISKIGSTMVRPIILQMMKAIGKQFVMGEDIASALKRAKEWEKLGYTFSYDMLGESARTKEDADFYFKKYDEAIDAIGKEATLGSPEKNPGLSVKLSALHPRYEFAKRDEVLKELTPRFLILVQKAKNYQINLNIDAEEADRLDLSLDIFERIFKDPSLEGWEGFGLTIQAYQKRAFFVIDWLANLSKSYKRRIMVRLVKGAYWDSEIKLTQMQGLNDYPVFTRKNSTDVCFIACAKKLIADPTVFYPQFGTHNAYSVAAVLEMTSKQNTFEFQGLHGMCRPLYDQVVDKTNYALPCRIYAPVGTHKDLLGYLVRRLLENGANNSFINQLADPNIPIEKIIDNPVARINSFTEKSHPRIPKPKNIYFKWQNSAGVDLSNTNVLYDFKSKLDTTANKKYVVGPIINGKMMTDSTHQTSPSPADFNDVLGQWCITTDKHYEKALQSADKAKKDWASRPIDDRAKIFEKAADLFQAAMPELTSLLVREGGKCITDSIAEIREVIDYCRYYAYRGRLDLSPVLLPGPTGEENQLFLHPRGIILCISPWNFPLAIFIGQVIAALVTGNAVIAKPAEQTPIVAAKAIQILHQAGVPPSILQLLLGPGSVLGAKLVNDLRIDGVMFTGSTETARSIAISLANREGPIVPFIAETGGQNAMIVDSSALPEQTILDIAQSAFNSAGQRCSALRVLFIQEEIAPRLLKMLSGYMDELKMGLPQYLSTDIGPVIDQPSFNMLKDHAAKMNDIGKLLGEVKLPLHVSGHYFAPKMYEINHLSLLKREVFGPILHVIRYKSENLDKVMAEIINTGYGLTLGIHSRIETSSQYIAQNMPVGNIYINRNMIGAVVGVQPFGGERLSGTGPKAGGPHYLSRLCVERAVSTNTTAVGGNARLISLLEED